VPDLKGAHGGHWLLATLGILLALTLILVLVPTFAPLAFIVPVTLTAFGPRSEPWPSGWCCRR
jgi:hypothetical protein